MKICFGCEEWRMKNEKDGGSGQKVVLIYQYERPVPARLYQIYNYFFLPPNKAFPF